MCGGGANRDDEYHHPKYPYPTKSAPYPRPTKYDYINTPYGTRY